MIREVANKCWRKVKKMVWGGKKKNSEGSQKKVERE